MSFFSKIGNAKNRLTRIGTKEPLNFLSIVILIALDVFVLYNIFQGLGFQTKQLVSPREAIPYACQNFTNIENSHITDESKVLTVLKNRGSYFSQSHLNGKFASARGIVNDANKAKLYKPCMEIYEVADILRSVPELQGLRSQIENTERKIRDLNNTIRNHRNSYDTLLLEQIANQQDRYSLTDSRADKVKSDIDRINDDVARANSEILDYKAQILQSSEAQRFLEVVNKNAKQIQKHDQYLKYWYPLKKLMFQLIFLLPLLILFFVLYKYSVKREKGILTLIFSHLLVIVCIPIVIEVFRLFFQILPFHFFANILEILEALGLITLWNYILIILGIFGALALIYFVQKKLFSQKRLALKRIHKKQCCHCGTRLEDKMNVCYKCGEVHLKKCESCHHLTFKAGEYCQHCGSKKT